MKTMLVVILSLAIFLGLAVWNERLLDKTANELAVSAQKLRLAISEENWDQARTEVNRVKKTWTKHKKLWLILIDHEEVDEIDSCLFRIDEMVKVREKEHGLSDVAEFRFHVLDVADKEAVGFSNIF